MTSSFIRITFTALAVSAIGWFLPHSVWMPIAMAQTAMPESHQVVEVPVSQLKEIQDELRYLRARDEQRQAWEESVATRLPPTNVDLVSQDRASEGNIESQQRASSTSQTVDSNSTSSPCRCHCYPCQCPLSPTPCVDCPRVSTISPYFNIHFFGALKLDMLFNEARPVASGVPFFLAPGSTTGLNQNTVDINARQTTLGAAFTGPKMGSFQSGGMFVAMLFNDSIINDQYGFLPLQAFGELKNEDWRFAGGLQFDVFAPGVPTMLPFSALAASGNAGNSFRGQLRLERFFHPSEDVQWTLQGAVSEPVATTIDPAFRINEDNGWPNVEGRIAWGLGKVEGVGLAAMRPFEVGLSGMVGQMRNTPPAPGARVVEDVWGGATDFRWKMTDRFGFMGEVYTGQTLGTYNGCILQNINPDTLAGIRSSGGWLELFYYWTPCFHSHTGYGIDDPLDNDVNSSGRVYNSTIYSNLLWDLNQTFRVGFEVTWRKTMYKAAEFPDNEGAGFQTQVQWAF